MGSSQRPLVPGDLGPLERGPGGGVRLDDVTLVIVGRRDPRLEQGLFGGLAAVDLGPRVDRQGLVVGASQPVDQAHPPGRGGVEPLLRPGRVPRFTTEILSKALAKSRLAGGKVRVSVVPRLAPAPTNLKPLVKRSSLDDWNSYWLGLAIRTTPNAAAIATGHYPGDTGDFSNTVYAGFPVPSAGLSPTPFLENNQVLGDVD